MNCEHPGCETDTDQKFCPTHRHICKDCGEEMDLDKAGEHGKQHVEHCDICHVWFPKKKNHQHAGILECGAKGCTWKLSFGAERPFLQTKAEWKNHVDISHTKLMEHCFSLKLRRCDNCNEEILAFTPHVNSASKGNFHNECCNDLIAETDEDTTTKVHKQVDESFESQDEKIKPVAPGTTHKVEAVDSKLQEESQMKKCNNCDAQIPKGFARCKICYKKYVGIDCCTEEDCYYPAEINGTCSVHYSQSLQKVSEEKPVKPVICAHCELSIDVVELRMFAEGKFFHTYCWKLRQKKQTHEEGCIYKANGSPIHEGPCLTQRQTFESGATRSNDRANVRFDLICPTMLERLARTMAEGAEKYGEQNWCKGIPIKDCLNHLEAHIQLWKNGDDSEDHLAHAIANLMFIVHFETSCRHHEHHHQTLMLDKQYLKND